ncbi:MAG: tetratricopeptide repeat protein [Phycisphaera sp.]|nr:tetratricopeptide repeat protein [Phycisphaera sp.]
MSDTTEKPDAAAADDATSSPTPPAKRGTWAGVILAAILLAGAIAAAVWYRDHGIVGDDGLTNAQRREVTEALDAAGDYIRHDKIPKARLILMKLVEMYPEHAEANHLMAQVELAENKPVLAYGHLQKSLEIDPNRAEPQFSAGVLAQKMNRYDDARAHFVKAAQLEPNNAKYPLYLGQLLLKAGKTGEAMVELNKAHKLDPTLPQVYGLMAQVAEQRGDNAEALQLVNKALEQLKPGDESYDAYMLLKALVLRKNGDPDTALAVLYALPAEKQAEPAVADHFAACYVAKGRYDLAAGVWATLYAAQPFNARAAAEAGLLYLRGGDVDRARRFYNISNRLDRLDPSVKRLRTELDKAAAPAAQ